MIPSQTHTIQFLSKKEVAKDTYSFYFGRPKDFVFLSGQYNRWTLPITAGDGRGQLRIFTISSSPLESDYLSLTTKVGVSDFKKELWQLQENQQISIFGPMGRFTLDESDTRQKVFIAGGIGITPFYSMVLFATVKNLSMPITLLVSFSTPEEAVFYNELTELEKTHPNIKIIYTITHPEASQSKWSGETGRISSEMIQKYVPNVAQSVFYMAGPSPMVESTKKLLLEEMQINNENLKIEQFSGYE